MRRAAMQHLIPRAVSVGVAPLSDQKDLHCAVMKLVARAPSTSGLARCAQNAKLSVEEFQEKVMAASRKARPSP